jgi:uncharacterized protein YjbJ (UPF0337 family)
VWTTGSLHETRCNAEPIAAGDISAVWRHARSGTARAFKQNFNALIESLAGPALSRRSWRDKKSLPPLHNFWSRPLQSNSNLHELIRAHFPLQQEPTMGEFTENVKGITNEAVGNVKQGVGKLVGDKSLEAEGLAQEVKGEAQYIKGDIEEAKGNDI